MATISSTIQLVDKMSSTLSAIQTNVNNLKKSLNEVTDTQSSLDSFSWSTFLSNAEKAGEKMEKIGKKMTLAITTPLTLFLKSLYGTATDYESAFAGVKKTTEATEEEYAQLYDDLLRISETNPTGFVDAAGIMEMAGQLGIGKDGLPKVDEFGNDISEQYRVATEDLTKFTEVYIGLQESTNISGEQGAANLARFLNVTEKTTANVDRIAGVIVGLGNANATTENEILEMATRMGATADLAGFSATEILAFSAALSSVGINAEAGGSAAGKLMKKMQLAAELGGKTQSMLAAKGYHFESGLKFVNALSKMKMEDKANLAEKFNMDVDTLQRYADSWKLFDQFSEVMGLTGEEFLSGWNDDKAGSLLKFFQGLGSLDPEKGNSVLAQLAEMNISEIRLSNLVAAMAGNSDLFMSALEMAYAQYGMDPSENAQAVEVAKRYETQESQNAMLANKFSNTKANFGQNLVDALQPVLDIVNDLLTKFNQLSETDQTRVVIGLGLIALLGPSLTVVGTAVEVIAKMMGLIASRGSGAASAVKSVVDAANGANAGSSAAGAAGTAGTGMGLGAKIAGGAALAGVTYLFAKGIQYRNEHGALGSVEAIERATEGNQALRDAFVEWVAANNEVESMWNNPDITEEQADTIVSKQQEAIQKFFSMDNAGLIQDLYNDWRTQNNLSIEDWLLPDDFLSTFDETPFYDTGVNITTGLANGVLAGEGTLADACRTVVEAGLAAANDAAGVESPSKETYWTGEMLIAGYVTALQNGAGDVATAGIQVFEGVQDEWNSSLWDTIGGFAKTEQQALSDEFNHVKDGIKADSSFIQKVRQLAEREVINKFTTAEVKVEMNNTNNISSDMDIDSVIAQLEDRVAERLEVVAEGVYS